MMREKRSDRYAREKATQELARLRQKIAAQKAQLVANRQRDAAEKEHIAENIQMKTYDGGESRSKR